MNNYTVYMHIFPNNKVYIGISPSRIVLVLKGKRNQTIGYKWKYKTEYNIANAIFN